MVYNNIRAILSNRTLFKETEYLFVNVYEYSKKRVMSYCVNKIQILIHNENLVQSSHLSLVSTKNSVPLK